MQSIIDIVVLNPHTAERRDVSENTPPEAKEISQGRGFCTPRPERLPVGEGRGQSRGLRGVYFPIHPDSRQCTDILSSLLLDNRWRYLNTGKPTKQACHINWSTVV